MEVSRQAAAPKSALLQKDTEGKPLIMQVLDQPVHSPSSCSLHVTAEYPPAHVALMLQEELLIECHTNTGLDDLLRVVQRLNQHHQPTALLKPEELKSTHHTLICLEKAIHTYQPTEAPQSTAQCIL